MQDLFEPLQSLHIEPTTARAIILDTKQKIADADKHIAQVGKVGGDAEMVNEGELQEVLAYVTLLCGQQTYVCDLMHHREICEPFLRNILGDVNVLKLWWGVDTDARYFAHRTIAMQNVLDLQIGYWVAHDPTAKFKTSNYVMKTKLTKALRGLGLDNEGGTIEGSQQTADFSVDPLPDSSFAYALTGPKYLDLIHAHLQNSNLYDEETTRGLTAQMIANSVKKSNAKPGIASTCPLRVLRGERERQAYNIVHNWRCAVFDAQAPANASWLGMVLRHEYVYALAVYDGNTPPLPDLIPAEDPHDPKHRYRGHRTKYVMNYRNEINNALNETFHDRFNPIELK
jgi:hypothetical protein